MGANTASAVIEQSAELSPAAHKPRHHDSGRGVHVRGDLLMTDALDIGVIDRVANIAEVVLASPS